MPDVDEAEQVARDMVLQLAHREQVVRRVEDPASAAAVRRLVRRAARAQGVQIRTAFLDGAVVVVRVDAAIWDEDTATMRRKLTPDS